MSNATLAERVRTALEAEPGIMMMQLARQLHVPEVEVLRVLPDDRARELDASRWEEILREFEHVGDVHVVLTNSAATVEVVGRFGNFSTWGEFFNVQSNSLDMHIRYPQLKSIFAVEKPSHANPENRTLSIQFFDEDGHAAFKVFFNFGGPIASERAARWESMCQRYAHKPGHGKG